MTVNSQGQHIVRDPQQSRKNSARGIVLAIALLGVFLSASAQAEVFTVNTNVDLADANPGNGVCDIAPPLHVCTLRAAIQEANALPGADTIILPSNAYVLDILAELTITDSLTLTGGGPSTTIIDGNRSVRPDSGVLRIAGGSTVSLSGVSIRNGGRTSAAGGGILNSRTVISDGILMLTNITVSGNSARRGGGIGNGDFGFGTVTLINSTVSGNSAVEDGGGIYNVSELKLINSTVSGNNARGNGGGIFNTFTGFADLSNATITNNQADADFNGSGTGGGVFNDTFVFNFRNTIIAGNGETRFNNLLGLWVSTFRDCAGALTSIGHNLMRNIDNCKLTGIALIVA